MTATAANQSIEFLRVYGLQVETIPTNRPMIRVDHPDSVFPTKAEKERAVVAEIRRAHATGQPVLVGTASVADSERLSTPLVDVPHEVLNARHDEREAVIIARAGQRGAVTVSTNMAGRGTDIRLGDGVAKLGGLYVIGTNKHESRRQRVSWGAAIRIASTSSRSTSGSAKRRRCCRTRSRGGWSPPLLSVSALNALRSQSLANVDFRDRAAVLAAMNEASPMSRNNGLFFTLWYGVYDRAARSLCYSSGGHPPAILRPGDGTLARLLTGNPIVGAFPKLKYQSAATAIPPGATLYVFSDGVYEVEWPDGAMWTLDELGATWCTRPPARLTPCTPIFARCAARRRLKTTFPCCG